MNMTAFSTQHPAIELGCHVCGLQETRLAEAGRAWAREVMEEKILNIVFGRPGSGTRRRRDCCWTRCGVAESTLDKAGEQLSETGRYVRTLAVWVFWS